jgi:tetratricopeptide (TPR) repeat protein
MRLGHAFAEEGKLEEAADAWAQASRLAPSQAEAYLQLAKILEQLGRPQRASAEFATLATIVQGQGDEELAAEYCREALRLNPDNTQAQAMLTSLQSDRRQPASRAPEPWDEPGPEPEQTEADIFSFGGLEEDGPSPQSPMDQAQRRALQELADMLFEAGGEGGPDLATVAVIGQAIDQQTRGMLDDAIESLRQALSSGLVHTSLFFNLGALCYQRMRYDEAIEAFRRSMRDQAYTLGSHYALGLTHRAAGNTDRSLEHFIELVKTVDLQNSRPDQVESLSSVYQRLGDSYIAKGDTQEAGAFTETLLQFFSSPHWERKVRDARRLMDRLADDGNVMTLAEYLETPETEVVVTAMSLTGEYIRRNLLMTAAEECFRAIQKAPSYLPLHVRLADVFLKQKHNEEAITKYLVVAEVYQIRGDTQEAISIFEKILRLAPMDVRVRSKLIELLVKQSEVELALEQYLILADVYYQLARVDQALEKYHEALRLAPGSANETVWKVDILHRMGDIYNQRVDWARAAEAYETIVAVAPDDERAQVALVDLYYKQGQNTQALEALDTLLGIYQNAGKTQRVVAVLQEAVQTRPEEMGLRARMAAVYARQGMTREAIAEYDALGEMQLEAGLREEAARTIQTIISLGPDDAEGYRRLYAQIRGGGL